jgi:hypothetical protein
MQQKQECDNAANNPERRNKSESVSPLTGTAIAILVFLGLSFAFRVYIDDHITDPAESTKVWIESLFSLALTIAVISQVAVYLRQAKALDAQIQATERNTIYGQRAYVYAKIGEVREDVFDIVLLVENSGNSPANDVKLSYSACFRETDPHKSLGDWNKFHGGYPIGLLAPKIHYPHTIWNRPVPTPKDLSRYYARYWNYHCWGQITYKDVFNNEWYTSFAFYVTAVGNIKVTVFPGLSGNEAT